MAAGYSSNRNLKGWKERERERESGWRDRKLEIEDGMLNSRRVEHNLVSSFHQAISPFAHALSVFLSLSYFRSVFSFSVFVFTARVERCAHLDKLNYKLDGSLVATRGSVVDA